MNIFYLDSCPKTIASWLCDQHIIKMQLESAQMLCTAHRILDGIPIRKINDAGRRVLRWYLPDEREQLLYQATHVNHPSSIWTRASSAHYQWHLELLKEMQAEYTRRYNKQHKTEKLVPFLEILPHNIKNNGWSEPPLAMPEKYKTSNTIESYRIYYAKEKIKFATWKYSQKPFWLNLY